MGIVIDNIIVGPMGKIKAIKLRGVSKLVMKEDVIDFVRNYPNDYRNFSISERGNFIFKGSNLAYNSNKHPIIVHEKGMTFGTASTSRVSGFEEDDITKYSNNELNFSVYKVVCEKIVVGTSNYKIIQSMQFLCNTPQSIRVFKEIGAKQISDNIFELSQVQLHKLISTSKLLNKLISDSIIMQVKYTGYLHYNGNIHLIEYDNSNQMKLQKWMEKAKVLGILNNYEIDMERSALTECRCTNEKLILPPVRMIKTGCLYGVYAEELIIPDTVMSVGEEIGKIKGLKKITFGENLIYCPSLFIQDIKGLEQINFNNISRLYIRRCFSNLYEAQLKLSTRIVSGVLSTFDTDVFVELIED